MIKSLFRKKRLDTSVDANNDEGSHSLHKVLNVRDITALGIAAIIGAGIFSTIGTASSDGGPGVVFLFLFTALACSFAAFCYADFASRFPVAGSAYTYAYVSFGELFAWIIGWALIMEYAIGNITVAISWSDYFTGLLGNMGLDLPTWMTMDYFSAHNGYKEASLLIQAGKPLEELSSNLQSFYHAYQSAPQIAGFHLVLDIPALLIIVFITWLVYKGMKESRDASNLMVIVKISVVILVIVVGAFYVNTENWNPFMPNGVGGILKGVSAVFFAYIGFDAISTTAEECKDPQRDLPRGMMYSIIICTVLYVAIALVLTGMVKYDELAVGDPLAFVFDKVNLNWLSGVIAVSAIFAMASVLLVFQLGQPRIWMSMSRDGLLPKSFSKIHPKYKTPSFATIVTGFVVAVPALFLNLTTVTDLCSIGTLFAFVLVCGGVLVLHEQKDIPEGKFKIPFLSSRIGLPVLFLIISLLLWKYQHESLSNFFSNDKQYVSKEDLIPSLNKSELESLKIYTNQIDPTKYNLQSDLHDYLNSISETAYQDFIIKAPISDSSKTISSWNIFKHKIPMWIFIVISVVMLVLSLLKNYSLIPVLGILTCLYMMAQIPLKNWIGFSIWLIVGLIIYFGYSIRNSKLANH
jgi:APA family basic amino acid/polyamine antiporter